MIERENGYPKRVVFIDTAKTEVVFRMLGPETDIDLMWKIARDAVAWLWPDAEPGALPSIVQRLVTTRGPHSICVGMEVVIRFEAEGEAEQFAGLAAPLFFAKGWLAGREELVSSRSHKNLDSLSY